MADSRPAELQLAAANANRSFYARRGKRLWESAAVLLSIPFSVPVIGLLWLLNAHGQRSLRRSFLLQTRVGQHGRRFSMLKLRTLHDPGTRKAGQPTPFGAWLRRTHLDELPQIWNVLKGDMSLIGPRPELPEIDHWARQRIENFDERLRLRPGMTGLAQITQGYARIDLRSYQTKLEFDQAYLLELSFLGDLRLLLRTALWVASSSGDEAAQTPSPRTSARGPRPGQAS